MAVSWIPVSIKDWTGREIVRVYTDEFGTYNALLPSTYTANVPSPAGYSPNMLTAVLNDPGPIPDPNNPGQMIRDPFYSTTYSVTPWTFNYMPGATTYLDTPIVPIAAFAVAGSFGFNLDTLPADASPVIKAVDGGTGGPLVCTAGNITITSVGPTVIQNPNFSPTLPRSRTNTFTITRNYDFGTTPGQVTLDGVPLTIVSWAADSIVATVPAGAATGRLLVTRGDNGLTTETGVTLNIDCATPIKVNPVAGLGDFTTIQAAIDAATAGDLILVAPGSYNENVIMYKPVRLQGSGAGSTFIDANPTPTEKLQTWHDRIELPTTDGGLGGAGLTAFTMISPFINNEAPGIIVMGELEYPGGTILLPDPGITNTFNPGNTFNVPGQAAIDGFTISGSKAGGGIFALTQAHNLVISNNVITGNQGTYAGGVSIGTQDLPGLSGNSNVVIRNNFIHKNGGFQGAGGISLSFFSNDYLVEDNLITGNFSRLNGGGIAHTGLSDGVNVIRNNRLLFNEVFFQAVFFQRAGLTAGDGGGIFISGDIIGGSGSGNVIIDGNLIQGNLAGTGHGGGIRAFAVNGDDVRNNPANDPPFFVGDPPQWYELKIFNNIIANNVATNSGGGIALLDVTRTTIVNNTIANNDSTATAVLAFTPGAPNSTPQPAGVASAVHSAALNVLFDPILVEPPYSNPLLVNNIIWHNRSFYNDAALNGNAGGLAPNPASPYWDLGVTGAVPPASYFLNPTTSVLTTLTDPAVPAHSYDASNIVPNPALNLNLFEKEYFNSMQIATVTDEGGNNINVFFLPLAVEAGDYHLSCLSPAADKGVALLPAIPELAVDTDGEVRPNPLTGLADIGADEAYRFDTPTLELTRPNGGEAIPTGSWYSICWTAPVEAVEFNLAYSLDNGVTWHSIAKKVTERSYLWQVPNLLNNRAKCLVRVIAFDAAGKRIVKGIDKSDAPFSIEVVRLTSPNGGEILVSGTPFTITWATNATKRAVAKVRLAYTVDGGTTWKAVAPALLTNPGSFSWTVPTVKAVRSNSKVRVTLLDKNGIVIGRDTSNLPFTIRPAVP